MGYSGICVNCDQETANPKFCSRSCSTSYNNRLHKRREVEGSCETCGTPISTRFKFCVNHQHQNPLKERWLDKNLNSNEGNGSAVRRMARIVYKRSGRPYTCVLCGYDTHVDICHIKDIRSYPHGTPYAVVNDPANLIALCKNHHWEFDHNVL